MQPLEQSPLLAAQHVMTDMLHVIHQICEKHQIKYWISDGTLLGSIRHGGFIPWDDDADVSMLREDYQKFMQVVKDELPSPYFVESEEHQTHGLHNWCKIMYMDDFEWVDWHGNWTKGLSVDIFPYDYVAEKNIKKKSVVEKMVNRMASIRYPTQSNGVKSFLQRMINSAKIHNIYCKFNKKSNNVTYGIETPYYGWAYLNTNDIFPLTKGKFAQFDFNIPRDSDRILTILYGDYMQLPKEEERVSHMAQLRFSARK